MLKVNVAKPATAEWGSPIVFVPKRNGSLWFCVDYLRLNEVTERESYATPRMEQWTDSLGTARIFFTLDANSGYRQIEMDKKGANNTAFVTQHRRQRYVRMSFGLKNAPPTFRGHWM